MFLALAVLGLLAADRLVLGWGLGVLLGQKLDALVHTLAFWR